MSRISTENRSRRSIFLHIPRTELLIPLSQGSSCMGRLHFLGRKGWIEVVVLVEKNLPPDHVHRDIINPRRPRDLPHKPLLLTLAERYVHFGQYPHWNK